MYAKDKLNKQDCVLYSIDYFNWFFYINVDKLSEK